MNALSKQLPFAVAALSLISGLSLLAAPLPIVVSNPGFENPGLSDGASTSVLSGWSAFADGAVYTWNPDAAFYPDGAQEGQNVGDILASPAFTGFAQVLQGADGQFKSDTTYVLSVKVGRNLLDAYDGYIIQLAVNDVVIAQDDNSRLPTAGSFVAASLRYTYDAALHSGLVGQPIQIRLLTKGLTGGFGDVNFDDVQFTYETSNAVAVHGGPYRLTQNSDLNLDGSDSLPSSGGTAISLYEWDLDGDGDYDENITGATPTIPYASLISTYGMELGANTIGLRITDDADPPQTVTSTTTVTIYRLFTYVGPNTSRGQDERWNRTDSWNTGSVPSGLVDVLIPASKSPVPCLSSLTPVYSGNLTIGTNSQISVGWTSGGLAAYNALGTPGQTVITMNSGSSLNFRIGNTPIIPGIVLTGNASVTLGSSTGAGAQASFNHPISGNHRFSLYGNNRTNCIANFNVTNTFNEVYTTGVPYADGGVTIAGNAPGSLGVGDLTLTALSGGGNSGVIIINAENAMADSATLSMSGNTSPRITMNANDTIGRLVINGAPMPAGTYGSPTSSATYKQSWIAGNAILTVTDGESTYWDINGATAGAGGATPAGVWSPANTNWTASSTGTTATSPWIAGGNAVFAAGTDATGSYVVSVGDSNAITLTNSFTASSNTGTSSFSVTRTGWALNGGNCVAVLVSSLNATGFTATYNGLPMTVQGVNETRNSYTGIAYIIGDGLPATGNVVITVPYVKPAINTGAYGNMGTVYSILSLSNVASAGTPVTRVHLTNPPTTTSLTYSTSVNNSFVLGIASDSNWQNQLKTVVGQCSEIITQAKPAYFNTIQCYGPVASAGSYTDVYGNRPSALITLPFNAKTASNPLLVGEGQKIAGLGFEEGTVTLTGSKLNLQANSSMTSASGITGTISSQITGVAGTGIVKRGLGTLVLSNATNNYTGVTSVVSGILRTDATNALPNTVVSVAGNAPGVVPALELNGYSSTVAGLSFGGASTTSGAAVTTGAGILTLSGNVEFNGQNSPLGATVAGHLSLGSSTRTFNIKDSSTAANDLDVSAIISGTGGLTKIGLGTLVLSGGNTYTGATIVTDGLLVLSGSNASATGGITVNNNAAIRFDSLASINGTGENVTINSGGLAYFGPSFGAANIPTALTNRIDPASMGVIAVDNFAATDFDFGTSGLNVYLGALNDVTYTGAFSPFAGTYRIGGGSGTLTLSSANALAGANNLVVGGSVVLANSNSLSGTTTINSSGRLQIGAGGTAGSLSSSSSITNDGMLVFNRSDTFTQGTDFWASISGDGIVQQAGSGVLVLNGENTYFGGTNLVSGTLRLGHANAIGDGRLTIYSGTLDAAGPGALTMTSNNPITIGGNFGFGGTADLNLGTGAVTCFANPNITLNGTSSTLTMGGVMSNASGGNQTITVNGVDNTLVLGAFNMSNNVFASNMAITIGGTGNLSITGTVNDWTGGPDYEFSYDALDIRFGTLTKTGSGILTLSGNNNYTGHTTVAGGVLHLASGNQISPITVNNGGILAFTLGSTITSTERLTLQDGHSIRIVGTPALPSYTLMSADSIVGGIPTLESPVFGYFLEIAGNELRLTQADTTPPTLVDITNDQGVGSSVGPILPNTLVTYTLTFNEDIDDATVTAVDFANAGTSSITIGTIMETSPGVFTVQVTPTTVGTLELQIVQNAEILDMATPPNPLDTSSAINDGTVITVAVPDNNWLLGTDIEDDQGGNPVSPGTLVTYTLYFDRDIDHTTVTDADFANAGSSPITIGNIAEISPGTFTVEVTPTGVGTLRLSIPITAEIRDPSNNLLDNNPAIVDDTTINVISAYNSWAGEGNLFDDDLNGDGMANGLAWLLGATDPNENARYVLPVADEDGGDLVLSFFTLNATERGTASIKVQYSTDLGVADLWTDNEAEVPSTPGTSTVDGIEFDIQSLEDGLLYVEATIPASAAGTGKKLFTRVSASMP